MTEYQLLKSIFTFACSFGFLLSLYAGLFVALSLAKLCLNARTLALTLKTTKRAVKGFTLFDSDLSHILFSPPSLQARKITYIVYTKFFTVSR